MGLGDINPKRSHSGQILAPFRFFQCHRGPFDSPVPEYDPDPNFIPYFESEPCKRGFNKKEAFTWKGEVRDGRFHGPGKFKSNGIDEEGNTHEVCFTKSRMFGNEIGNITGINLKQEGEKREALKANGLLRR